MVAGKFMAVKKAHREFAWAFRAVDHVVSMDKGCKKCEPAELWQSTMEMTYVVAHDLEPTLQTLADPLGRFPRAARSREGRFFLCGAMLNAGQALRELVERVGFKRSNGSCNLLVAAHPA